MRLFSEWFDNHNILVNFHPNTLKVEFAVLVKNITYHSTGVMFGKNGLTPVTISCVTRPRLQ